MDRKIVLQIKGNSYTVEFPNVGKFQAIETMKQVISKGMYASLISTSTLSSIEAADMINIEAYFSVCAPKILEDLECESFSDLDIEDYLVIKKVYQETFVPWWNQILDILSPQDKK